MSFAMRRCLPLLITCCLILSHDAVSAGLGKVIYARRDGSGVLFHAERGDMHVSFPAPTIVRLRDRTSDSAALPSPVVDSEPQTPYARFEILDPRFQVLQSEALRVEIEREPFSIRIKDIAGNLLLEDDGPDALTYAGAEGASWRARFEASGSVRGFGLLPGADARAIYFSATPPPVSTQGLYVAPTPFGRLNDRCAIVLRTAGESKLGFPSGGTFDFSTEGPFEAWVSLATSDDHYWSTLQFLLGRSLFPPRWLMGTGYTLDDLSAMAEIRGLGSRLIDEGFQISWLMIPASRNGRSGWNLPLTSLNPNPDVWGNPAANFEAMQQDQVQAVFEVPSRFPNESRDVSLSEFLEKQNNTAETQPATASSISIPTSSVSFPFDYASEDADSLTQSVTALAEQGFAYWLLNEDLRPPIAGDDPDPGALRPLLRADSWNRGLEQAAGATDQRRFVLDREARADLNRLNHLPAPWRIDPKRVTPVDVFHHAQAAALAGLTTWGIDLPLTLESYPSSMAMRRWLQTALAAPYVLLRAPDWAKASPPVDTADLHHDLRRLFTVRARLRPWLYSLARATALSGLPMTRAVEQSDPNSAAVLLGGDVLFAAPDPADPALQVELPEGEWVDLNSGESLSGGRTLNLTLAASTVPAYARRGTLIPFWGDVDKSESFYFVARLYPSAKGQFALYEDAGEGAAYKEGKFAVTQFSWEYMPTENALNLLVAGPLGEYAAEISPRDMMLQLHTPDPPLALFMDEKPVHRTKFIRGSSRLLDPEDPLQLHGSTLPAGAVWDHDGGSFLYVWLPQRAGNTRMRIYLPQTSRRDGQPDF